MTDFTKLDKADLARVTTKDGRKVRILCTDGPEEGCRLIGIVILPPAERVVWMRDYDPSGRDPCMSVYTSRPGSGRDRYPDYRLTLGPNPKIERVE